MVKKKKRLPKRRPKPEQKPNPVRPRLESTRPTPTFLLLIFLAAFGIRLLYLTTEPNAPFYQAPVIDCYWHYTWAKEIAEGNLTGEGAFFRAPLYPYTLAAIYRLFGSEPIIPRLFQHFLGSLSCVLMTLLAFFLTNKPKVAYLAGCIAACYVTLFYFEGQLLIVTLIIFLDLAALAFLAYQGPNRKSLTYGLAGLILGLSAIARPNILVFWPFAALWLWMYCEKEQAAKWIARVAFLTLGVAIPVSAVTVYNYYQSGDFVLIASQGGINFYIGNNPHADGKTPMAPGKQKEIGEYKDNVWVSSQAVAEERLNLKLTPSEVSQYWFKEGLKFIVQQPAKATALILKKIYYFFHGYEIPNNMDMYFYRQWSWIVRVLLWDKLFLPFGLIGPLGIVGILLFLRTRKSHEPAEWRTYTLMLLFAGSYAVSVIVFFVNARYRLPTVPVFIVFTAYTIALLVKKEFWQEQREVIRTMSLLLILIILLNAPLFSVTRKLDPAWDVMITGSAFNLAERYEKALQWYHRALEIRPEHPYVLTSIGVLYVKLNRLDAATDFYLRALKRDPSQIGALINLSSLYMKQGDPVKAVQVCRQALEVAPKQHAAAYNLGTALFEIDQFEEAEKAFRQALDLKPDKFDYLNNLAALLMEMGKYKEAVDYYRQALEQQPMDAMAYFNLGICLNALEQSGDAMSAFEKAIQYDTTLVEAAFNLGILSEKAHRYDEAIKWYERTLTIEPKHISAMLNLGQIYGRVNQDYGRAIELLENASRLAPDDAGIWYNLGLSYRLAGRETESQEALQRAVHLAPQLKEAVGKIGGGE